MNNAHFLPTSIKGRTLLIVEGNHEKNELFKSLFKCFPELEIADNETWIYGTNIYSLYDCLVREYGNDWYDTEVNLPLLVSKEKGIVPPRHKDEFKNIILVFDYERHDPKFSEGKIQQMQSYFTEIEDVGKLYINYPMIESYQHLSSLEDKDYENLSIPVTLRPGSMYKALVRNSFFDTAIQFPDNLRKYLVDKCHCQDDCADKLMNILLNLPMDDSLFDTVSRTIDGEVSSMHVENSKYYITSLLKGLKYISNQQSYWQYLRYLFQIAIKSNIGKSSKILQGTYVLDDLACKEFISSLNLSDILDCQNLLSHDPIAGQIWVLNTCILMVAEYNYNLLLNTK